MVRLAVCWVFLFVIFTAWTAASHAEFEDDGFYSELLDMGLNDEYSPLARRVVTFQESYSQGTIVVDTVERRLYYVLGGGQAIRYAVGVGREGYEWSGTSYVSRKAEWPSWTPPAEMRDRQPDLPTFMPGGPGNPMGARALYLGATLYRIHGTNNENSIGRAMSSGCIRLMNDDVIDLYERVRVGARVVVR